MERERGQLRLIPLRRRRVRVCVGVGGGVAPTAN